VKREIDLRAIDAFIGFCVALVWMTLLALARKVFAIELDARWILVSGAVVFGLVVWGLCWVQARF
jgi:hypothetical protein